MFRLCVLLLLSAPLAIVPHQAAHPQQSPPDRPTRDQASPPGALTPDQARAALETLNDPKQRAAVAATLEALIRNQQAAAATAPTSPPPPPPVPAAAPPPPTPAASGDKPGKDAVAIQLAPDSLGAQVLLSASSFLSKTADELTTAVNAAQSIPLLWGWAVVMVTNPLGQRLLADTGWRLAITLSLALGVWLALHILLRRPMARVLRAGQAPPEEMDDPLSRAEQGAIEPLPKRRPRGGLGRRLGLSLARFGLQLLPVAGLLFSGHMAAVSNFGGGRDSRLIILAVLDAIAVSQALLALVTMLFMPEPPGLKLLPLRPSAGAYLVRWGRLLILIAVPGYAIGVVALLLGLSATAQDALQKFVGLILIVCLAIIVVQRRRSVGRWLSAAPDAHGAFAWLRNGLARYWYTVALFFLAATWIAWTLSAPDAVARISWYFVVTVAVVLLAAIARALVLRLLAPIRHAEPDTAAAPNAASGDGTATATLSALRLRLSLYHPVLRTLATLAINILALLMILQLYGVGSLSWLLTSVVGQQIISGILALSVTIALAIGIWEGVNIAIQSHLETLRRGAQAARSARLRTLLPLIRTTLAITVAVVAGLMVLSEIGVNIGPLLAGAGIVGVAIGFGSQKLVQDVITGVFLLLENTMQVGDVVKVGDQSGLVESLSVRTIRLRTEDGSVVVIPFSAVTTVINMTRDYSRAVITVNIAQDADIDRVLEVMRKIVNEMRKEDAWSSVILDELEVMGLDRIIETALQIKCRIMCTPFGRWSVGREFNRRLKMRFQLVGVTVANSAFQLLPVAAGAGVAALESAAHDRTEPG